MNSRAKGKGGELEAAHYLSAIFGLPVRRGCQYQGTPDSPDIQGLDGLAVEVKRRQRLFLDAALAQAERDAAPEDVPLVLHRSDHAKWKLTFYADDLIRFLTTANRLIEEGRKKRVGAINETNTDQTNQNERKTQCP